MQRQAWLGLRGFSTSVLETLGRNTISCAPFAMTLP